MNRAPLIVMVAALAALTSGCSATQRLPSPKVAMVWGTSGEANGELRHPSGIAVSAEGAVFVADTGNHRIQKFDLAGRFIRSFGERGQEPGQFLRPMDVALGRDGLLYVAELGGDRVQVFTQEGGLVRVLAGDGVPGGFDGAAGVLPGPEGSVYVVDFYNDRVVRLSADGRYESTVGTSGRVLPGRLHYPTDVAWSKGRLVVADAYNNRVQVYSSVGENLLRFGGPLGSGLPGSGEGSFRVATGVATDSLGRIYVADFENHRIQVFDAEGRFLTAFGSRGTGAGQLERPTDLDFAADGRIYVVDFGNDRVQVFEALGEEGS